MLGKIKRIFNAYFWRTVFRVNDDLKLVGIEPSRSFLDRQDQLTGFVAEKMRLLNNTNLDGFCYRLDHPNIIEPSLSYSIVGINKLVRGSIFFTALKPSAAKYLKYRLFKKGREIHVDSAVLFDGQVGGNYFHFFCDVFNRLWLLDYYHIDSGTPLIISRKTFETKYFQFLHKNSTISKFNWLIQDENDFIKCDSLFLIKPAPYNKPLWDKTIALTNNIRSSGEPFRRLFVNRPKNKNRGLSNLDSIVPIVKQYGFEIIDPGLLSFEEQVRLFSEAEIIIGLHGAALTNTIFAVPQKLRLLEIGPYEGMTAQFYWLALTLNFKYYNCIFGTRQVNSKYEISIEIFEKALTELLAVT